MKEIYRTRLHAVVLLLSVAFALVWSPVAQAYDTHYLGNGVYVRWYGNPTFKVSSYTPNWGSTSTACDEYSNASFRNDFNCAVKAWSDLPQVYIQPTVSTDWSPGITFTGWWEAWNAENEVDFVLPGYFDVDEIAKAWRNWYPDGSLWQTDIGFNTAYVWLKGSPPPSSWHYDPSSSGAGGYFFRSVAQHEVGHALGLDHEESGEHAVMNTQYPDGGWYRGYGRFNSSGQYIGYNGLIWPHADDIEGLYFLYPNSSTVGRDIAISRSKFDSTLEEAVDLASVVSTLSTQNEVCPNGISTKGRLTIEYTLENRGNESFSSSSPLRVIATLSRDIWIHPSQDVTMLNGYTHALGKHKWVRNPAGSFYVPVGTTPQTYYVGVYAQLPLGDYGSETTIFNNGVHLRVAGSPVDIVTVLDPTDPKCQ